MTKNKYSESESEPMVRVQRRLKFENFLASDPYMSDSGYNSPGDGGGHRDSSASAASPRGTYDDSEYEMSPWHQCSPYTQSPWSVPSFQLNKHVPHHGLLGSLVREEGHVYSLATHGALLYTGSESKNIRVWKDLEEHSGFKSSSGLVKAIVVNGDKVFTGHQDGKIRVWRVPPKSSHRAHKRIGSLPKLKDVVKKSMNPKNYVEVRRHRNELRIRHYDAVSCLSLDEDSGLLYSGSWDKTVKCWRIADSKCLESITAHDDAVNAVTCGFDRLVFTGSADGKVKVWRREIQSRRVRHFLVQTLLDQESAVTAVAVNEFAATVYCGSSNGLVNYWDRKKQFSPGGVMRGHKQAVLCLATAGSLVFSGSADKTICMWRRGTSGDHMCLSILTGHAGPVKCLAVENDPNPSDKLEQKYILYSGSLDKSVKVWRVSDTAPKWQQLKAAVAMDTLGVRLRLEYRKKLNSAA